jgi:chemotaxis regulatin CheY-phosphate phosphatase CheZ
MTEIAPLLVNINNSIEESNAKIPKATDHIVDVTSATELATTEILDLIDAISSNTFELTHTFNDALSKEGEIKEILTELALLVTDNSEAKELVEKLSEKLVLEKAKAKTTEALDKILMDATNIAIALQVQDITTQQLAAVNHLILSVQKKLSSLMFDFSDDEVKQVDNSKGVVVPEEGNFDMNASFHNQVSSQDDIDKMIIESNNTSQDDIDKLFG